MYQPTDEDRENARGYIRSKGGDPTDTAAVETIARIHGEDAAMRAAWLESRPVGESIAVDVRGRIEPAPPMEPVARVSTHRRYVEGDTLDERCTGYIDEVGYLAHDGPVCPIHESGDVDPGDETDTPEENAAASTLAALFTEGQRIPELDADDFGELVELVAEDAERRGYRGTLYRPDREQSVEHVADELRDLGRQIAAALDRLEAAGALEPGRSLVSDHVHAALDDLDHAIEALTPEEEQ